MKLFVWWILIFGLDFAAKCQEQRYGLKGKSIRLSFSSGNQSDLKTNVVWRRFNRKDLLAKKEGIPKQLRNKIILNTDWSLALNDLHENDTGLYEALSSMEDQILASFWLSVEHPVPEPVIRMSSSDFNSSAGACRAMFNCSVDGSWASYECDQTVCWQTHSSLSSVNITATALDSAFWCNASNHVSYNHSQATKAMCHEKQQSDQGSPPPLVSWLIVAVGSIICMGLTLATIIIKKKTSVKVHPQSRHDGNDDPNVVKEHHETIYSTIQKPDASQTPAENGTETTIYDTPTRHPKASPVDSVEVTTEYQEPQRSGSDTTLKVTATVHQEAEADSDQINTVYCKLGEI